LPIFEEARSVRSGYHDFLIGGTLKKLNEMFHIEGERLIKTSNGQPVPEGEPIFILRGRDQVSVLALISYREECERVGTPQDRLQALDEVIKRFADFSVKNPTKVP